MAIERKKILILDLFRVPYPDLDPAIPYPDLDPAIPYPDLDPAIPYPDLDPAITYTDRKSILYSELLNTS